MTTVATQTTASHMVAQTPVVQLASAASAVSAVSAVLRDAAFVMMMTKKVKDQILGKTAEPSEAAKLAARRRTAAGVIAA